MALGHGTYIDLTALGPYTLTLGKYLALGHGTYIDPTALGPYTLRLGQIFALFSPPTQSIWTINIDYYCLFHNFVCISCDYILRQIQVWCIIIIYLHVYMLIIDPHNNVIAQLVARALQRSGFESPFMPEFFWTFPLLLKQG